MRRMVEDSEEAYLGEPAVSNQLILSTVLLSVIIVTRVYSISSLFSSFGLSRFHERHAAQVVASFREIFLTSSIGT